MRIDTNQDGVTSVIVTAKVKKKKKKKEGNKCPFCGRKCLGYDQGGRKSASTEGP